MSTADEWITSADGNYRDTPILSWPLRILVSVYALETSVLTSNASLSEGLQREIQQIVTNKRGPFQVDKKRMPQNIRSLGRTENLKEFRRHLTGLCHACCVMICLIWQTSPAF
jgi:hypothetical protein